METFHFTGYNKAAVQIWLFILLILIFFMVLIGGLTRLTDSGLSITDWAPLMGAIPPMSEEDWIILFDRYRETSEFFLQNSSMTRE